MLSCSARILRGAALSLVLGTGAAADTVTATLVGSRLESLVAGGQTFTHLELTPGSSSGTVLDLPEAFGAVSADDRDLATYFARNGAPDAWVVTFPGGWTDTNGAAHDFFLFEVGGGDPVSVRPVLPGGALGQPTTLAGWTGTGYGVPAGPNVGQGTSGLAFRSSQLLGPSGQPLAPGVQLAGLRFDAPDLDVAAFLAVDPSPQPVADGDGSITHVRGQHAGEPFEFDLSGPFACETDDTPNPFLDHRVRGVFSGPGGQVLSVPAFFAADGAGGECGNVWRVRFLPPQEGTWTLTVRHRVGSGVALSTAPTPGSAGLLHGATQAFQVARPGLSGEGLWRFGHVGYVGDHHRRSTRGPYRIKTGANSPENFLACKAFDGVAKFGGLGVLHSYGPHALDHRTGDPLFDSDAHDTDSRGVIGALNYLGSVGVNSLFALVMNLGGDGQDVHPFVGASGSTHDNTHFDVSRLEQWNVVFEHAASRGVAMHLALAETEAGNQNWLDNGAFGPQRKLLMRELVARFAHLPCLQWNLSEESVWSAQVLRSQATWLESLDAYRHPVTWHNLPNDLTLHAQLVGDALFESTSLQFDPDAIDDQVEQLRASSAQAGHPWVVNADEHAPAQIGALPTNRDELRKRVLYDVLLSGGGLEWYMGYHPLPLGGDLSVEDFRTRDAIFRDSARARYFLEDHLPFWRMQPADDRLSGENGLWGGGQVLLDPGQRLVAYLPSGSPAGTLDLSGLPAALRLRWFDPRDGGFVGPALPLAGGGPVPLPAPPAPSTEDWLLLVEPQPELEGNRHEVSLSQGGAQVLSIDLPASYAGRAYQLLGSASGTDTGFPMGGLTVPLNHDDYTRFTFLRANTLVLQNTRGTLDPQGDGSCTVRVPPGAFPTLVGLTLHHSLVLFAPNDHATEPVALRLLP